jgi:quercetin dioxygenase-like cupin family protein
MPVMKEHDAVAHRLHGAVFHSYAAPARGSVELCAWRLEVQPGVTGVPHRVSREEVFLVLAGAITVTLDGVATDLTPGDVALVPAGSEVAVDNRGADPARVWVTTSAGLEATTADGTVMRPPWTR